MNITKGDLFTECARKGDMEGIRQYLDVGGDPDYGAQPSGVTALIIAVTGGHIEVVQELLQRGTDINHTAKSGLTCVHAACVVGNHKILEIILNSGFKDIDAPWTEVGVTPMYLAAQENQPACLELLLLHGADPLKQVRFARNDILYPCDAAIALGNHACVDHFILWCYRLGPYSPDKGELPKHSASAATNLLLNITDSLENLTGMALKKELNSITEVKDESVKQFLEATQAGDLHTVQSKGKSYDVNTGTILGITALHLACLKGNIDVIHYLLAHGARVNIQTESGFSPLYFAAQEGHKDIVDLLLKAGADPCLGHKCGLAPLGIALCRQHSDVVTAIQSQCPSAMPMSIIDECYVESQMDRLVLIAAHKGDVALLKRCIDDLGVDVNKTAALKLGERPIHIACQYGRREVVEELLRRGASLDYVTKRELTPVHCAALCGSVEVLQVLLDRGIDIEKAAEAGMTALMIAAQGNFAKFVEMLLLNGANPGTLTPRGRTCVDIGKIFNSINVLNTYLYWCYQVGPYEGAQNLSYSEETSETIQNKILTEVGEKAMSEQIEEFELIQKVRKDIHRHALEEAMMGKTDLFRSKQWLVDISVSSTRLLTPLHCACYGGHLEAVQFLLQCRVGIDKQTKEGFTPLYLAAQQGHVNIVEHLLKSGANPCLHSKDGLTPVGVAMYTRQKAVVDTLLKHTPDIPPIDPKGTYGQKTSPSSSKCVLS